jgi:hypothetical protein
MLFQHPLYIYCGLESKKEMLRMETKVMTNMGSEKETKQVPTK